MLLQYVEIANLATESYSEMEKNRLANAWRASKLDKLKWGTTDDAIIKNKVAHLAAEACMNPNNEFNKVVVVLNWCRTVDAKNFEYIQREMSNLTFENAKFFIGFKAKALEFIRETIHPVKQSDITKKLSTLEKENVELRRAVAESKSATFADTTQLSKDLIRIQEGNKELALKMEELKLQLMGSNPEKLISSPSFFASPAPDSISSQTGQPSASTPTDQPITTDKPQICLARGLLYKTR